MTQNINKDNDDLPIGGNTGALLNGIIERIERIQEEIDVNKEYQKEVYGEAKSIGFDVKILRKVIKRRKMEREKRDEEDQLVHLYEGSIASLEEMME